jgi:hypothetical protein
MYTELATYPAQRDAVRSRCSQCERMKSVLGFLQQSARQTTAANKHTHNTSITRTSGRNLPQCQMRCADGLSPAPCLLLSSAHADSVNCQIKVVVRIVLLILSVRQLLVGPARERRVYTKSLLGRQSGCAYARHQLCFAWRLQAT